jgi:hypothetical protein
MRDIEKHITVEVFEKTRNSYIWKLRGAEHGLPRHNMLYGSPDGR